MPTNTMLRVSSKRKHSRCHSIVEKGVILGKVDNAKGILLRRFQILNRKEKPLSTAMGVNILLHHEIILIITNLKRTK
jgi:hypothetical protein